VEALFLERIDDLRDAGPEPSHMVTVYGADHPGIVHAVSSAVARHGYDITDLNTHLSPGDTGAEPLYVLMMEVAVEQGHDEELNSAMEDVARGEGVEVSVGPLETDEL
jgi:glycine cleavage system transcriptional repressor